MPVINGALGAIKKGLDPDLKSLPGHHSAKELQKFMLMNIEHIIRKVLGYGYIHFELSLSSGPTRRRPPSD